jgi:3-isopropylmalate/(R)-2-methylmalate dehydratase large subunit
MGMTVVESILARKAGREKVVPGEIVTVDVDVAMTHDALGAHTIARFKNLAGDHGKVWSKDKIVIILDHYVPSNTIDTAKKVQNIENFVEEQGLPNYFGIGRGGICHKVLIEKGYVVPGALVAGTDSHTTTHGVMGAFGIGIGIDDMAAIWKTGRTWEKVPETLLVEVSGRLGEGIYSKDLMLKIVNKLGVDGAIQRSLQFTGETVYSLSVDSRTVFTNMAIEVGATNGIIDPDEKVINYLKGRTTKRYDVVHGDHDARYERVVKIDASDIDEPLIAAPWNPANVKKVSELEGTRINQAFVGSCTNGRFEDLQVVADILKRRTVAPHCRMVIIPASQEVYQQAAEKGLLKVFVESNAFVSGPTCGPCMETHMGILGPDDVMISSANRNFRGRAGHHTARIFLASPATVAASAVAGYITDPRKYQSS